MKWLNKFMQGRAGGDQLSFFLLFISILITFAGRISGLAVIELISYLPLFFGVFRIFSKNISQRRMENYKFMIRISPLYKRFHRLLVRRNSKTHKHMRCTACKTTLRLPKGKGKIRITCPTCRARFIRKT